MKVGDLVVFESDMDQPLVEWTKGIVFADHEGAGVDILWSHGEISERMPRRILKVLNESR